MCIRDREWLVQAPVWVQMAVLAVTAVPAATVMGWLLMWAIDRVYSWLVPVTRMKNHDSR